MAKQWEVPCKDKGTPDCLGVVKYTDRSYRKMLKYGHSRPEYCPNCQKRHQIARMNMAVSYFSLKLKAGCDIKDLKMGPLGMINHPERKHSMKEEKSRVEKEFGVKEENIRQVYEWFKDPKHRVVIVIGGTGSGKSTKFVNWLATPPDGIPEDFFTRYGQILVGQPRRVAASGTAEFTAALAGGVFGAGGEIGFSFSGVNRSDWRNLVVQKTHGQILNIIENGDLKNVGLVMVDEAHERSLEIDSILRNLKEQLPIHPHLRVVIASATIDSEKFRQYFGEDVTAIVNFESKSKFTYRNPVTGEVDFAEEPDKLPYENLIKLSRSFISATVNCTLRVIKNIQEGALEKGDILVFMPGKREVEKTVESLANVSRTAGKNEKRKYQVQVLPLFRGLPDAHMDRVVQASEKADTIRIIVSTNIAEASVTITSLVYVVETGLAKVPVWEESSGQTRIPLTLISQANAQQRWGRAGRVRNGRVFTLYTKSQYETLMTPYPKPDIQRLNLENLVMNGRAAGITDLKSGWLQEPPEEEIQRAVRVLTEVNALDKENSLTDYGRLLRRFEYSAKIVDMLLAADLKGCLIEAGTLIPIIKNGGIRQIFHWDRRWSAKTKYEVYKRQQSLMSGCRDDIEFLLKVFSSWECDPTRTNKGQRSFEEREAWCRKYFVNNEVLTRVAKERGEILSTFYVHKKDMNFRPVSTRLISRIKTVLATHLKDGLVAPEKDALGHYFFKSRVKGNENSLTTFSSLPSQTESDIEERLFCDQLLPVNGLYTGRITKIENGMAQVEIERVFGGPVVIAEILSDGAEDKTEVVDDDEENEEEKGKKKKEAVDEKAIDKLVRTVSMGRFKFPSYIKADSTNYQVGQKIEISIEGFEIWPNLDVYTILRPISEIDSFANFISRVEIGDQVELSVTSIGKYPEDPEISLITAEKTSGAVIALDPEDAVFANAKTALDLVPVGSPLNATVIDIDEEHRYVKASLLPEVEKQMNILFAKNASSGGRCSVEAKVLEWDPEYSVHLILNWSQPEKGLLFVVSKSAIRWPKPLEETVIGEKFQANISFHSDWDNSLKFPELPKEVEEIMSKRIASNLKYTEGKLIFSGRMTFDVLQELLKVTNNFEFRRAIRKIYWKSNQPFVGKLIGDISKLAPGQVFTGTVSNSVKFGVFVNLPVGVDGLIHSSKMGRYTPGDFRSGMKVEVKVIGVDQNTKKIALELVQVTQ